MRNLTLGVLIVAGGTLAALPFRRYQSVPAAPYEPVQATGPAHSALDVPPPSLLVSDPGAADSMTANVLAESLPRWQESVAPTRPRSIDIPLTFDDLMTPIDQPLPIEQRFNAIADVQAKQIERQRVASLEMPPMEALEATLQDELREKLAATQSRQTEELEKRERAAGSLASAAKKQAAIERLPEPNTKAVDRHWIRQP